MKLEIERLFVSISIIIKKSCVIWNSCRCWCDWSLINQPIHFIEALDYCSTCCRKFLHITRSRVCSRFVYLWCWCSHYGLWLHIQGSCLAAFLLKWLYHYSKTANFLESWYHFSIWTIPKPLAVSNEVSFLQSLLHLYWFWACLDCLNLHVPLLPSFW